jgi:integrase
MTRTTRGEGTIQALSGDAYLVKVPVGRYKNGVTRYKTSTCRTMREAKRVRREMLVDRDAGRLALGTQQSLRIFATQLLIRSVGEISRKTADNYLRNLRNHVFPILGGRLMSDIKTTDLEKLFADLSTTLSSRTITHIRTALSRVFSSAELLEIVPSNPVKRTTKPRRKEGEKTNVGQPFSKEEARNVLGAAAKEGGWLNTYISVALGTGMREGEILGLKWGDIDFQSGAISVGRTASYESLLPEFGNVRHEFTERKPKAGSYRRLTVASAVKEVLSVHREEQLEMAESRGWDVYGPESLVFLSKAGTPIDARSLNRQFRSFLDRNEIRRIRPYDLRHTFATAILTEDARHIASVAKALGHRDLSTTLRAYASTAPVQDQATAAIGELLFAPA